MHPSLQSWYLQVFIQQQCRFCIIHAAGSQKREPASLDVYKRQLCDWLTNGYKFNVIRVKDVLELEEPCEKISIYKKEGIEAATSDIYDEFKDQAKICLLYTSN